MHIAKRVFPQRLIMTSRPLRVALIRRRKNAEDHIRLVFARLNRRLHSRIPVIGITGSTGKTTTKDLCTWVLSEFGNCLSPNRSMNTHDSVARLIAKLRQRHKFCVVELSEGAPGYLDLPLRITRPNVVVLTVLGREHYSAFRSLEAIAEEVAKAVTALQPGGVAVLNIDDPLIRRIGEESGRRVIWIGKAEGATIRLMEARSIWPEPLTLSVTHGGDTYTIRTRLHGKHLAGAVLATLGVAVALELSLQRVIAALETVEATEGRMQPVEADGIVFLRDDWKAPHWSFQAPLEFLRDARARRKIAVVGTVSDSADSPSRRYPKIAREVLKVVDLAIFVGPDAFRALKARSSPQDDSIQAFVRLADARDYLKSVQQSGDLVLLKGTNKQDHLGRLALDRSTSVRCWSDLCRRNILCGFCRELDRPAVDAVTSGVEPMGARQNASAEIVSAPIGGVPRVIVGLGNPGESHRNTPHNVGHHVLELIAESAAVSWEEHPEGLACSINLGGEAVTLLKPGSVMNSSGVSVHAFLQRTGASARDIIVVYDDTDLMLGDVRPRQGGSGAGHKGIQSVIASLGTVEFPRIRVGVRPEGDQQRSRHLVLERMDADDPKVAAAYAKAVSLIREEVELSRMRGQGDAFVSSGF
jgi:UDP-N-acetylmuramoyl-tripeptide--D-alanyl-D-alanine ligase